MTTASAVETVTAFVAKINAHDVNGLVQLMTPDHVFIDALGAKFEGAENLRHGWTGYYAWFPDYAIEVTEVFDKAEVVALFGEARGTYAVAGKLPQENRWKFPAAWKAIVKDGRVAEWRVYGDNEPARKIIAANDSSKKGT